MSAADSRPWPTEIRLNPEKDFVTVLFDNDRSFVLAAEMLRVMSPSAEVQGHSPSERKTIGGKRNVRIDAIDPVGNYAVRIRFDDGHASGIFTWDYLHALGEERDVRWTEYLEELAEKGLTR
jgi:DUF971 family protein